MNNKHILLEKYIKVSIRKALKEQEELQKQSEKSLYLIYRFPGLKETMENLMSVYEENVPVEFLVKDGALKARTKTDHGTVSDTLKGREAKDMKAPASVHPVVINDILNRLKGETVRLTVHSDKCLMLETSVENVDYVYSCILL